MHKKYHEKENMQKRKQNSLEGKQASCTFSILNWRNQPFLKLGQIKAKVEKTEKHFFQCMNVVVSQMEKAFDRDRQTESSSFFLSSVLSFFLTLPRMFVSCRIKSRRESSYTASRYIDNYNALQNSGMECMYVCLSEDTHKHTHTHGSIFVMFLHSMGNGRRRNVLEWKHILHLGEEEWKRWSCVWTDYEPLSSRNFLPTNASGACLLWHYS